MKQRIGVLVFFFLCSSLISQAQTPTAVVNGQVRDTSGAGIPNASVEVINDAMNVRYNGETNDEGIYSVPNLPPGAYHIRVSKPGFKTVVHPDITLNVQDAKAIGFTLPVGPVSDTVTVEGGTSLINTESATVSTVVDRQFAENLPMNGRSFQTLIQLTPGVVLTASNVADSGQFSVNGQRASSNYWMVDGVGANIGIGGVNPGNGFGGALGSFTAQGGTNSLVSVDALQEFRIQTSTYAPEFGRTPGGQISIVTRSGTNQFHGTLFDYLRNDVLDANDWFGNSKGLPKPREHQNDFGGTFSGPVLKERIFFFFSYEGLRLRLPQTTLTTVPCDSTCQVFGNARTSAVPAVQPYLNAFPLPNGPEVFRSCTPNVNGCPPSGQQATGAAEFNASYSNPASLDAYSVRIDHKLGDKLAVFGRYNYSPSENRGRGFNSTSLSTVVPLQFTTQTGTVGSTWTISSASVNDLRFNYSRSSSGSFGELDNFGGAVPLSSLPLPSPFTSENSQFFLNVSSLVGPSLRVGHASHNVQRQINVVDNLSLQRGSHALKAGVDFRRLSPSFSPPSYLQGVFFSDVPSFQTGRVRFSDIESGRGATFLFRNLGAFAQDAWRATPRLTVTYGVRWDVDFAPATASGPSLLAVTNFNDISQLALAPAGTPIFNTHFGNVAPRVGLAYQLSQRAGWTTVLRGGFGVFFDLATSEIGNTIKGFSYPFGADRFGVGGTFPYDVATAAPPPIVSTQVTQFGAFDPQLQLPYTLQWNAALEQSLGQQQTLSASYVGSVGRRLLETSWVSSLPNPIFGSVFFVGNEGTADYNAFQLQLRRPLLRGLQALASYGWSHSIDEGSAGSAQIGSNALVRAIGAQANRGPSDFDIRQAFSGALTYNIPAPKLNAFTRSLLGGWSIQNIVQARTAPPVSLFDSRFSRLFNANVQVRLDLLPGMPLYLSGNQYPGGKVINPAAFLDPPAQSGKPTRQGNLARNALRGFGATQWDLAVHRDFAIRELLKLQFRAELFNVLNHPNFGSPVGDLSSSQFGRSTQVLGRSLDSNSNGGGAFSPLYQMGGPRSIQFALKLQF